MSYGRLELCHLRPWGSATYTHNLSHKNGKLGPRRKKSIFKRYLERLKSYVFISENTDGSILEIESHNVTFLENIFSSKGKLQKDFQLFKIDDPNSGSHHDKSLENVHDLSESSAKN